MDFNIEKYISSFVENQFPRFYQEEGPVFIQFVKAYYEWMEEQGNPIGEARTLLSYRDIDSTVESFLEYFQKKYLYGIPFNVIVNKRYLLKHILDVYRSKGTVQGYKLLFKLIFDEELDIYLPGEDVLKVSDGTWVTPKYIEITKGLDVKELLGKEIVGTSSGTGAVVEDFVIETFNRDSCSVLYLSNISPVGGDFIVGEKIVIKGQQSNTVAVESAATIIGSLNELNIINGGQGFEIGDVIKIAQKDPTTGQVISSGSGGLLRVTQLKRGKGELTFNLINGGFGYIANAQTFVYRNQSDTTGVGASFDINTISNTKKIQYNTDILCDYMSLSIDAASYGFPLNASANLSSNIGDCFSYSNAIFGTIASIANIKTGNSYTLPANVFVRSVQTSKDLPGTVTYNTSSNTVTGSGTSFDSVFSNDDVIFLHSNTFLASTIEIQVIRQVTNSTQIILYGPPNNNSTASTIYKAAPSILSSEYALTDSVMIRPDGTVNGLNEKITATPSTGNNIISKVTAINSGKSYTEGELVKAYLYGAVETPTILFAGSGYANGETLVFSGGGTTSYAQGFVSTDSNGSITSVSLNYAGSGYNSIPTIRINTANGYGALLTTKVVEFNTFSEVTGRIAKSGLGKGLGYWSTTKGLLNSDKYIQDSLYYQDYSYEFKVALSFDKYKDIMKQTFESAGSELFGNFFLKRKENLQLVELYTQTAANTSVFQQISSDVTIYTVDDTDILVSDYYAP